MIKTCIKFNPSTGIFRKNDNCLIGWTLYCEFGLPAFLYIDDEYRRQKIATYVVAAQTLKLIAKGIIFNCCVKHGNEASIKFQTNVLRSKFVDNRDAILIRKKHKMGKL